jgi:hypothetical protein
MVPYKNKERTGAAKAAQRASSAVQLPLPIRKGFLTLHVSVLPLVLPVESIYHRADDREGETVGDAAGNPRNDYPELIKPTIP